jgi:hypothetical protein
MDLSCFAFPEIIHLLSPAVSLRHVPVPSWSVFLFRALEIFADNEIFNSLLDERHFGLESGDKLSKYFVDELGM